MIHLVTFASEDMQRSARACMDGAKKHGVDSTHYYSASGVTSSPYYRTHKELFSAPRGCGYWAWKPIIIDHLFNEVVILGLGSMPLCKNGDYVIYADAGVEFIGDVKHIIDRMDQDIFLFGNNWEHAHWCKRDVVEAVWPQPWSAFGKQCQASVIFFRVSDYSRAFVKEWLDWCLFEGGRLIDDSRSRTPNHPEFQENRHDQAILTTLAYREGIKLHWWPASYNDGQFVYEKLPVYAGDNYAVMFNHHRKRNHEWAKCA